ncbi:MAG: hypothetical protein K2W96_25040 [Gemmataceae bacterium]|nr:hypothetical protein [Gemmataceae bacterium]
MPHRRLLLMLAATAVLAVAGFLWLRSPSPSPLPAPEAARLPDGLRIAPDTNERQLYFTATLMHGTAAERSFCFSNDRETPVRVRLESASCGCLGTDFDGVPLKKGEPGVLLAPGSVGVLRTRFPVSPVAGLLAYTAYVRVEAEDGTHLATYPATVRAETLADASAVPHVLGFTSAEPATVTLRGLRVASGKPWAAPVPTQKPDWIEVLSTEDADPPPVPEGVEGRAWTVRVRSVARDIPQDGLAGTLRFRLGNGHEAFVPVSARRTSGLSVHPAGPVAFAPTRPGGEARRRVIIAAHDDRPFSILSVKASPEAGLSFDFASEKRTRYILTLVHKPQKAGSGKAEVVVATDHGQPTLTLTAEWENPEGG